MTAGIPKLLQELESEEYVADPAIATSLYLAQQLEKPLLIEGHAGVGKTEIAKVLARLLKTELIRRGHPLRWRHHNGSVGCSGLA